MGKTDFILNFIIENSISYDIPTLFFSLENKFSNLFSRLDSIYEKNSKTNKLSKFKEVISSNNLFIEESREYSIKDLKTLIIDSITNQATKIILIDSIHHFNLTDDRGNQIFEKDVLYEFFNEISHKYNVIILATSWLSSDVEKRGGDKLPRLSSDFGKSHSNYADLIMGIYRPSNYGLTIDEDGSSIENMIYLNIIRNRNGRKMLMKLHFDEESGLITEG